MRAALGEALDEILPEVWQYLTGLGVTPAGPPFTRYHTYGPDDIDVEAGLPVAESVPGHGRIQAGTLPGGQVAMTWHIGPYTTLPDAYTALDAWLQEQQWTEAGAPWEVYWTDPGEVRTPEDWRTQVFWPIR